MSQLDRLIGSKIQSVEPYEEGAVIRLDCGAITSYTPTKCHPDTASLVAAEVLDVKYRPAMSLLLLVEGGATIEIGLEEEHYSGPEAFCAEFKDGVIVVE